MGSGVSSKVCLNYTYIGIQAPITKLKLGMKGPWFKNKKSVIAQDLGNKTNSIRD